MDDDTVPLALEEPPPQPSSRAAGDPPEDAGGSDAPLLKPSLFWVSMLLLALFYVELDWWNLNVYRHDPYLDILKSGYLDKLLAWIAGFFFLTVFASLKTGGFFTSFKIPDDLRTKVAYTSLANRWAPPLIVGLIAVVYGLVAARPTVHFRYTGSGEAPLLVINDEPQPLAGSPPSVSLPRAYVFRTSHDAETATSDAGQRVVVSDELELFKVYLGEGSYRTYYPFWRHLQVDLEPYRPNFSIRYIDRKANKDYLRDFSFRNKPKLDADFLPDIQDPLRFLRRLFEEVRSWTGPPGPNSEIEGRFAFQGRTYRFAYRTDGGIHAEVNPTDLTSLLLLKPREGVQRFFDREAVPEEQQQMILEFRTDLAELRDDDERAQAYRDLWGTAKLQKARAGTEHQRKLGLRLIAEAFHESGKQLGDEEISAYIEDIRMRSLQVRSGIGESEFAVAAICSLASHKRESFKRSVLEQLEEFFTLLGTQKNRIFPSATEHILRMDPDLLRDALGVAKVMWKNGSESVRERISSVVEEDRARRTESEREALAELSRFLANPADYS